MELYNGDCLEVMDRLIEEGVKVDCIITDPPYGMSFQSNFRKEKFEKIKNDCNLDWLEDYVIKAFNVLKSDSHIYMFCSWHHIERFKEEVSKLFKIKNILIWHKEGGGMGDLEQSYMYNYEMCIYATNGKRKLNGKRTSDVIKSSKGNTSEYQHPTQKPVNLIKYLVEKSTNKNDIVLDSFMGSGTTGVACANLDRNFIGIELDKKYFDIATDRINEAINNQQIRIEL